MTTKTQIANMCFGHLGISIDTGNIDATTNTKVHEDAFNLYYDQCLKEIIEEWNPNFAEAFVTLTLVQSDPNDMWDYEYTYPSDCLYIKRIWDGNRIGGSGEPDIPFRVISDATSGRLIWTDQASAKLVYFRDFSTEGYMPAMFANGLSWVMAGKIAPSCVKGVSPSIADRYEQKGRDMIRKAMAVVINENAPEPDLTAEIIRGRD